MELSYADMADLPITNDAKTSSVNEDTASAEHSSIKVDTSTNKLLSIKRNTGEYFTLSYNDDGTLALVTDHTGRTVSYEVSSGLLRSVTTPKGNIQKYAYDRNKKLAAVTNPRGITFVENIFDENDRTIRQDFSDGNFMTYDYDDDKREVILTERNGSKTIYVHDEKFRDIKHIYHDGRNV